MKRLLKIFSVILFATAILSCGKKSGPVDVSGQWQLVSSDRVDISAEDIEVYIEFFATGRFELYQRNGSAYFRYYSGNYTVQENMVSGNYSDGTPWGCSYEASVSDGRLTLKSLNDAAETCTYSATAIPGDVSSGAVILRARGAAAHGDAACGWL